MVRHKFIIQQKQKYKFNKGWAKIANTANLHVQIQKGLGIYCKSLKTTETADNRFFSHWYFMDHFEGGPL